MLHRGESTWLAEFADVPDDQEILPGLTAGEFTAFHRRPADPDGAVFEQGVVYGHGGATPLALDLYRRADASERAPIVVFVHGGGWTAGHPWSHIRQAHALAEAGYVTATITYRLSGDAPWPASIEDTKCAVRWARAHADELGGDPDRIGISGGSAGGHLSAMVALTPGEVEGGGGHVGVSSAVQAAVLFYPATDVRILDDGAELKAMVMGYFGEDGAGPASPIEQVHPGAPPILSLTGDDDVLTTLESIQVFHRALDEAGVVNRLEVFEGPHGFDFLPAGWQESYEHLALFFAEHLGKP